jgi:hypothetical protein
MVLANQGLVVVRIRLPNTRRRDLLARLETVLPDFLAALARGGFSEESALFVGATQPPLLAVLDLNSPPRHKFLTRLQGEIAKLARYRIELDGLVLSAPLDSN